MKQFSFNKKKDKLINSKFYQKRKRNHVTIMNSLVSKKKTFNSLF